VADPLSRTLIVFARVPRLGEVKTRLAAGVGEARALEAYRTMLRDTLSTCASLPGVRTTLCIEGDDSAGECASLAARFGALLTRQQPGSLGQRMHSALAGELRAGRVPVLVGCDCPPLARADLSDAFDALRDAHAVFAPTEDGGYALVGLGRELPGVFAGPQWGSTTVMRTTRALLRAAGARWVELRTLWDVDDAADHARWCAWRRDGALPRTCPPGRGRAAGFDQTRAVPDD